MHTPDGLRSFDNLSPDVLEKLHELLRERRFTSGEQVFTQGESSSAFYLVAEGRVKITRITEDGYESILCVCGPNEFFCPVAALDGGPELGFAVAMEDTTILWMAREDFVELCQENPAMLAIVQGACLNEVRGLIRRMEALAFRSVGERLSQALLIESRRQADASPDDILSLTQQELAGLIGASRESVSRALTQLEREGVVTLKRGSVVIRDKERLQQIASGADR